MLVSFFALFILSPLLTKCSSFYDNPDQDPILEPGSDSAEELHKKWDFEVLS